MPTDESTGADQRIGLRPPDEPYEIYTTKNSELVIGLVSPLGSDNDKVRKMICDRLAVYGYQAIEVRLSKSVIRALAGDLDDSKLTSFDIANALIDKGNQIRYESQNNAVLAIAAAVEISDRRPPQKSDEDAPKTAYIINSLKRPEEIAELRKIYANGFYVFGLHSDRELRLKSLETKGMTRWQAEKLIARDEHEPLPFGQDTRNTFHLSDMFIADEQNDRKLSSSINRCLDLVFGAPCVTPMFNEFAMFMAFASSLRSADLSRQVGAVIARNNEILSTGCNDCPAAGGGLYWPTPLGNGIEDAPRGRDFTRGVDSNVAVRNLLIDSIVEKMGGDQEKQTELLRNSPLRDITEYGRGVHAEMEALLACARGNVSCVGATIYCTTFPCHNCAKHIIAAGIDEVIYIEPYPKSKAMQLHDDAISLEKRETHEKKVRFKPFIGIGPRNFFNLFSMEMSEGRKKQRKISETGKAIEWSREDARPRVQMLPFAHRRFEKAAVDYMSGLLKGVEK